MAEIFTASPVIGESLQEKSAGYYLKKGELQFHAEMYDYAILNLTKALDRDPKLYRAANLLAEIFILRNNRQKGIEYLKTSLEINNRQGEIHNRIGELYGFFAENRLARHHFSEAVKSDPENIRANLNISRYYILDGKTGPGNKHFSISYRLGKKKAAVYYNRGISEYRNEKTGQAVENLSQAIKLSPAYIEAYVALADIYRGKKMFRKAVDIMEKLKFVKPDYEKAYLYLGHLYFNGRLAGKRIYFINLAVKNLKKAIELNPSNIDAYFYLADIYRYIGDYDSAKIYENMGLAREKSGTDKK